MPNQFVNIEFTPGGKRYMYENLTDKLAAVGGHVLVPSRGTQAKVKVVAVTENPPRFACKDILDVVGVGAEAEEEAKAAALSVDDGHDEAM